MNNPKTITIDHFFQVNINCGTILEVKPFPEARKPAFKLIIDFGEKIGIKQTSAQITELYSPEELVGKQILAVTNFPAKRIAGFKSEVLVLGLPSPDGVVLLAPDKPVENGVRVY